VGAARGLNPGLLAGEASAGDKAPGDAVLGLRNGLLEDEDGRTKSGGGGRRSIKMGQKSVLSAHVSGIGACSGCETGYRLRNWEGEAKITNLVAPGL
jgi:hypothetical protein